MNNRHLWYSYDFANSFMGIVLIFYFPLILIEKGGQELWIGITSSIATACMLLLLPRVGHYVDTTGKAKLVLLLSTFCSALTLALLAFLFSMKTVFLPQDSYKALILFGIFYLFYESALTVYSGMMRATSTELELPRTSGYGYAFGQVGNVVCLLLTKFVLGSGVAFYLVTDKLLALLLGGIVGFLLTLPYIWALPQRVERSEQYVSFSYGRMMAIIKNDKRLQVFLVAMLLLYDTILTFQLYLASFMKTVLYFDDVYILYGGVCGLFFGVLGALVGGTLTRNYSPTYLVSLGACGYALSAFLLSIAPSNMFVIFAILALAGVTYGFVFSLGRTVYALIIPRDSQHEYFGIFVVFERMAAVVGPLLWTATFLMMSEFGEIVQYRVSVFGLAVVAVLAFLILLHFHKKFSMTIGHF